MKKARENECASENHHKVKSSLIRINNGVQKAAKNTFEVVKGKKLSTKKFIDSKDILQK